MPVQAACRVGPGEPVDMSWHPSDFWQTVHDRFRPLDASSRYNGGLFWRLTTQEGTIEEPDAYRAGDASRRKVRIAGEATGALDGARRDGGDRSWNEPPCDASESQAGSSHERCGDAAGAGEGVRVKERAHTNGCLHGLRVSDVQESVRADVATDGRRLRGVRESVPGAPRLSAGDPRA